MNKNLHKISTDSRQQGWEFNGRKRMTLSFVEICRDNHAVYGVFANTKKKLFPVFMSEMERILPKLTKGKISGSFEMCKKGANYAIRQVTEKAK